MNKIQYLRVEQGLSKRALARKAGISDNVVRRLEKGEAYSNVTIGTFNKIAKALNVDLFELIEPELLN